MDNKTVQALSGLTYDPETGELSRPDGRSATGVAMATGYLRVHACGQAFYAHRVAWFLKTGCWPEAQIDHANGSRADNRWSNLRAATPAQNNANTRVCRRNSLGIKGVTRVREKFKAQIMVQGQKIYLGLHTTAEAASRAYESAAISHYSEYARTA